MPIFACWRDLPPVAPNSGYNVLSSKLVVSSRTPLSAGSIVYKLVQAQEDGTRTRGRCEVDPEGRVHFQKETRQLVGVTEKSSFHLEGEKPVACSPHGNIVRVLEVQIRT